MKYLVAILYQGQMWRIKEHTSQTRPNVCVSSWIWKSCKRRCINANSTDGHYSTLNKYLKLLWMMCLEMDTSGRRLTLLTTRFTSDQRCVQWKPGRLHSSLLHNEDLLALLKQLPNRDPRNVEILTLDHQLLDQLMKVQTMQNVNDLILQLRRIRWTVTQLAKAVKEKRFSR